jgi:hypothetical protein
VAQVALGVGTQPAGETHWGGRSLSSQVSVAPAPRVAVPREGKALEATTEKRCLRSTDCFPWFLLCSSTGILIYNLVNLVFLQFQMFLEVKDQLLYLVLFSPSYLWVDHKTTAH